LKASTPLDAHDQQPPLCEIDPVDAPCHPMVYPLFFELAAVVARLCASRTVAVVVFYPALLSLGYALIKGINKGICSVLHFPIWLLKSTLKISTDC